VAWKHLATNLSDLAAKGAEPVGVLLGYGLAEDNARFAEGLGEALAHFGVPLLGGDTVCSPGAQTVGLTALGRATCSPVPGRSGARAGDGVWITGAVGAAMLGFEALSSGNATIDTSAYRRPLPRLAEGQALAPLVSAMMDVSDGLLLDASRMAEASGVTFALDPALIPVPAGLPPERARAAMAWGDDYELLFTLTPGTLPPCPAHPIGKVIVRGPDPLLLGGEAPSGRLGFEHC
jgi:thiamine-monophosphate kinase